MIKQTVIAARGKKVMLYMEETMQLLWSTEWKTVNSEFYTQQKYLSNQRQYKDIFHMYKSWKNSKPADLHHEQY